MKKLLYKLNNKKLSLSVLNKLFKIMDKWLRKLKQIQKMEKCEKVTKIVKKIENILNFIAVSVVKYTVPTP